eukprot:CAMPEP_0198294714 /NCGR_PEP_ID=MMETSP1449-20131203/23881_1 /TAXON_ID=420275 /ORGANISM="Attheya septentrionalis, Strain CCMP2084" /LENGTH=289 /DNA_ID=CAMNT_0043994753 /DNA_START=258 /DNA_END=1127 /DNA_ORIENTATION=+
MGWMALLFAVPDILLEHRDFYVVNKPAGIGMHQEIPPPGSSENTDNDSNIPGIVRLLSEHLQEPLYPVHRLDKITTGALLLGRNKEATRELSRQFAHRETTKYYLALSDRTQPSKKQGRIVGAMIKGRGGNWRLGRPSPTKRRNTANVATEPTTTMTETKQNPTTQNSMTRFLSTRFESTKQDDDPRKSRSDTVHGSAFRAFLLRPYTGKTHQLRVMLKSIKSPILGDDRYGGTPSDRGYLHAWQLGFHYDGVPITVRAPLTHGQLFLDHAEELEEWASNLLLENPLDP